MKTTEVLTKEQISEMVGIQVINAIDVSGQSSHNGESVVLLQDNDVFMVLRLQVGTVKFLATSVVETFWIQYSLADTFTKHLLSRWASQLGLSSPEVLYHHLKWLRETAPLP